jgi:hypothetical protein
LQGPRSFADPEFNFIGILDQFGSSAAASAVAEEIANRLALFLAKAGPRSSWLWMVYVIRF